jgi:hypothetical protein
VVQVDEILQVAGGVDAVRAVAGDQPRGPGPFAGTGRQHHGVRANLEQPVGGRDLQPAVGGPAGHHRAGTDLGARPFGAEHHAPRVGGAGQDPVQVADAESGVAAVPRDAAGVLLAFEYEDLAGDGPGEFAGGPQPGGAAADDGHRGRQPGACRAHRSPSSSAARRAFSSIPVTFAPQ